MKNRFAKNFFILLILLNIFLVKNTFANNGNVDDLIDNIDYEYYEKLDNSITANYAILMDYENGEILYQKNMNEIMAPSSMTKIMTAYVIFEMLKNKEIDINDKFKVSVRAWKQTGTRMFLEPEWRINVDELLKGLLIVSGNDAAITLAEGSSGTIANFVAKMNETARKLGMNDTNFVNPNGLYEKTHYMSVHDLAILSRSLIKNHYKYYKKYFSQKSYNFNNITQNNRNWLLTEYEGVDGIKTGFTEQGRYSIAASVIRNGKRLIAVVGGAESERSRIDQCKRLFDFGYGQYQYVKLFEKDDIVGEINVYFGLDNKVAIYTKNDIVYATKKSKMDAIRVDLVYNKYIFAPLKKDEKVAELRIVDGDNIKTYDLYSKEDVNVVSKFKKFKIMFKYYAYNLFKFGRN